jgi:predicted DNA-binding transcriptional regulator AlpA
MPQYIQPLPDVGFARQPTVLAHVPFSKSTLWAKIARGEFPKPVKLGPRITAWRVEEIRSWIERQSCGKAA